jgi:hypothetical protein
MTATPIGLVAYQAKGKGIRYNPSSRMYYIRKTIDGKAVYLGSASSLSKAREIYNTGKPQK